MRPHFVDPQTNIVYDTNVADFEGYLTKQSTWLQVCKACNAMSVYITLSFVGINQNTSNIYITDISHTHLLCSSCLSRTGVVVTLYSKDLNYSLPRLITEHHMG